MYLRLLPEAIFLVSHRVSCELEDAHPGEHVAFGQVEERSQGKTWWLAWSSTERRLRAGEMCPQETQLPPPDDGGCGLPTGHAGAHSFDLPARRGPRHKEILLPCGERPGGWLRAEEDMEPVELVGCVLQEDHEGMHHVRAEQEQGNGWLTWSGSLGQRSETVFVAADTTCTSAPLGRGDLKCGLPLEHPGALGWQLPDRDSTHLIRVEKLARVFNLEIDRPLPLPDPEVH